MRVSVIVSVYKDVEALALIIEALKKQTYTNFEFVVVEDGDCVPHSRFVEGHVRLSVKSTVNFAKLKNAIITKK